MKETSQDDPKCAVSQTCEENLKSFQHSEDIRIIIAAEYLFSCLSNLSALKSQCFRKNGVPRFSSSENISTFMHNSQCNMSPTIHLKDIDTFYHPYLSSLFPYPPTTYTQLPKKQNWPSFTNFERSFRYDLNLYSRFNVSFCCPHHK